MPSAPPLGVSHAGRGLRAHCEPAGWVPSLVYMASISTLRGLVQWVALVSSQPMSVDFEPTKESTHILDRYHPKGAAFKILSVMFDTKLVMNDAQLAFCIRHILRFREALDQLIESTGCLAGHGLVAGDVRHLAEIGLTGEIQHVG